MITQSEILSASELNISDLNNHIDSEKIQKLNESLYKYYRCHKQNFNSCIIADIFHDFSIEYKEITSIDTKIKPGLFYLNDTRNLIQLRISNNPQLMGTALVVNGIGRTGIEIYSDILYKNMKHNFDILNIPTLENFELSKEDLPQFSERLDVNIGSHQIIADDQKIALHTENLCDCVGIVAQGSDKKNKKISLLAHYYRDTDVSEIVKVLENKFDAKNTNISLITMRHTPRLLEIINQLKSKNFIIKGCNLKYFYNYFFIHEEYTFTVYSQSSNRISYSPISVLVIPGIENVFFSNKSLKK